MKARRLLMMLFVILTNSLLYAQPKMKIIVAKDGLPKSGEVPQPEYTLKKEFIKRNFTSTLLKILFLY